MSKASENYTNRYSTLRMEFLKNFLLIRFTTVGIIGSIFGLIIYLSNKKHIKETDKNPILTLRTGGHFGGLNNFSFPFVRTTLYEKFIVISYWKKIVIPYDQIITLKKLKSEKNWEDSLTVNIYSNEFIDWLQNEAYN